MNKADEFLARILVAAHDKLVDLSLPGLPCVTMGDDITGSSVQGELVSGLLGECGVDMMGKAAALMRSLARDMEQIACHIEAEIEPGFKAKEDDWDDDVSLVDLLDRVWTMVEERDA